MVIDKGEPMSGAVWQHDVPRDNYEISLEAMRLAGTDFFCGLTFPVGAENLTFILGGWGGYTVGLGNVDDKHAGENPTTRMMEFKDNQWYGIKIRVASEAIIVWLDGKQIIKQGRSGHAFDIWPQQKACLPLGISTWRTKGAFRKVAITGLEKKG